MTPTKRQEAIRDNTGYIKGSVHYHKRAADKRYEIVANLHEHAREALGLSIGGEIVLDVCANRNDALSSVRFFRAHKQTTN